MRLVYLLFLFTLLISGQSFAQTFSIDDKINSAKFNGSYYEFNEPVTDIDKAYQDYKNKANVTEYSKINRKYSKKPVWLAFTVKNIFAEAIDRIIQFPFGCTDEMELYVFNSDGTYEHIHKKHSTPLKEREFVIRRLSAGLSFEANEEKLIIAKLRSSHQVSANFDIYDTEQAYIFEDNYKTISVLYVGVALALLLFNFFVGFTSKKKSIYLYMGTLFLLSTLIMITADIPVYFGVVVPELLHETLPLHRSILISVVTLFTLSFLRVKDILPKTNTFFSIFAVYSIVVGLCSFFDDYYHIVNVILKNIMTLNLVMILGLAIFISIKTKSRPAFLFTLATASLFISGIIYMLTWSFGVIPRNFLTANVILLGSAIEMVLFSLAIADSFKHEISKQLEQRLKVEDELKNLNAFLEKKVRKKTDQLLASKKRAALGELATGIAHEMNSPLSAVYNNLQYLSAILEKEKNENNHTKAKSLNEKNKRIVTEVFELTNKLKSFGASYGDLTPEVVDLDSIVKSVLSSHEKACSANKFYLIEEKGLFINTYKSHLYNALSNIVEISTQLNEATFISINEADGLIEFELTGANKQVPEWIKSYLSIPFYEQSSEVKGSGLKLSMAKDAIYAMNGKIRLSDGSKDYIFKIEIPYISNEYKSVA